MGIEYPDAIDMFVPIGNTFNFVAPITIVDHCTGGNLTIESIYQTFIATGRSTHFGIGRDGRVAQYVHLNRGAGGNCCSDTDGNGNYICDTYWLPYIKTYGNLNLCTISIEHCNDGNNSLPLTSAQLAATEKLQLWLCERYNISTDHIKGHNTINPVNKANCPGASYPFNDIFTYINNALASGGKVTIFSNGLCIAVWNSDFTRHNQIPPIRDTGIFNSWRALWQGGHFKGCCIGYEYPITLPNGNPGVAQNFAGSTCIWDNVTSIPTWLA